ncbi:hypothetical protein [Stenotrophobium rhamnosiphilum]|uniref:DUF2242 domain-containing protein n=1 Tax=Stenotrophobium rhamnosiphilum TaxID=2029166 RepID=A0A2T5MKG5_9GAMM|nr:hypothetical protein [Stenotrophobium rhamnosiphilum]PTU33062.1 hypothetical protein CJD38_02865 [Stenotrophobium rhamnosiphilum]
MFIKLSNAIALAVAIALAGGCATNDGYHKAFAAESAIKGNHQTFAAPLDQTFRAVKITLIRQGFTMESADPSSGLIKATRNFQDPVEKDVSYNIVATADVNAEDENSIVTIAASQQTILHREWHTWWKLLWIIPIFPTGTEYQTVVTKEGNVTDAAFYKDFFASVSTAVDASIAAAKAKALKLAAEKAEADAAAAAAVKAAAEAKAVAEAAAKAAAESAAESAAEPVAPTSDATQPVAPVVEGVSASPVVTPAQVDSTPAASAPAPAAAP